MMKLNVREITVYGMLGALMYVSKIVMEVLPNVHLIGVFTIALTVVYRSKALFPIYIFVFFDGNLCRFCRLVDSLFVCLGCFVGNNNVVATKYAASGSTDCLYDYMWTSWNGIWNFICPCSGINVWV